MLRFFRASVLLPVLAACVLLWLPGCVKYKQLLTVEPDGSGRMELVMGMSLARLAQLPAGDDPFAALSIASLANNPQGFVAFSEPRAEDRDGFRVVSVTGYFDNVNDLGFAGGVGADAEGFDIVTYRFEPGRLTVNRPLSGQAAAAFGASPIDLSDPELRRVLAVEMIGLEFVESFAVPGQITDAGPLAVNGREARAGVAGDAALNRYQEAIAAADQLDRVVIEFEPAEWSPEAQAAWKAELADAKAAWARLLESP